MCLCVWVFLCRFVCLSSQHCNTQFPEVCSVTQQAKSCLLLTWFCCSSDSRASGASGGSTGSSSFEETVPVASLCFYYFNTRRTQVYHTTVFYHDPFPNRRKQVPIGVKGHPKMLIKTLLLLIVLLLLFLPQAKTLGSKDRHEGLTSRVQQQQHQNRNQNNPETHSLHSCIHADTQAHTTLQQPAVGLLEPLAEAPPISGLSLANDSLWWLTGGIVATRSIQHRVYRNTTLTDTTSTK